MNKVVLTSLAAASLLVLSACTNSGTRHYAHHGYSSHNKCVNCAHGKHVVRRAHHRGSGIGTFAKVAGTLAAGAILYNAFDDDDNHGSSGTPMKK